MQIDQQTFNDISIFNREEEFSIFHKLNFTNTIDGKNKLKEFFATPFNSADKILSTQQILKVFLPHIDELNNEITNGTLLVIKKFLNYDLDIPPAKPDLINIFFYKSFHSIDYSFLRFSIPHIADFCKGLHDFINHIDKNQLPLFCKLHFERVEQLLRHKTIDDLIKTKKTKSFTKSSYLKFAYFLHVEYKSQLGELLHLYSLFDAWSSMTRAMKKLNLCFPEIVQQDTPYIEAEGLFHILLSQPVPYNIEMDEKQNFLFLTGANMSGKSTLIKCVGSAVFLAHIGLGVPAKNFKVSVFDGLLSNINVTDNIFKGESLFYNEVQRIKNTIEKVSASNKKWLVLIDELFKGTNIQDAMKCSVAVIKGLIKLKNSLFILSSHLYEIGDELKDHNNISFKYFETDLKENKLSFSYQLQDGVSSDRLGYFILQQEKVIEMMEKL